MLVKSVSQYFPTRIVGITSKVVVGYFYKKSTRKRKYFIYRCLNCIKDFEMYGYAYFVVSEDHLKNTISCGCSYNPKLSERQITVKIKRKCEDFGYLFKGFVSEYKNQQTKIKLYCIKHGMWESCSVSNFLKNRACPLCAGERRAEKRITTNKLDAVEEICGKLSYNLKSVIKTSDKNSTKISIQCDKLHNEFKVSIDNFLRGRKCPHCVGKNQNVLYLNFLFDDQGNPLPYYKVGITHDVERRLKHQNKKNLLQSRSMYTWHFENCQDCKDCEQEIKSRFSVKENEKINRINFPDGFTEIVEQKNFEIIFDTIQGFGGVRFIANSKLSTYIENLLKISGILQSQ